MPRFAGGVVRTISRQRGAPNGGSGEKKGVVVGKVESRNRKTVALFGKTRGPLEGSRRREEEGTDIMMRKTGLTLLIVALMVGLMAGVSAAAAPKKDKVVIWERVMWNGAPAWWEAFKQTYEGMMQAVGRDVELEVELLPWSQSDEKWATAFLAGDTPDIGRGRYGGGEEWLGKQGIAIDIEPYLTAEDKKNLGEDAMNMIKSWSGGHMYGVPSEKRYKPTEWAINADLVRSAGFDPNVILKKGWTFDDVIAIAQKTHKPDKGIFGFGQSGDRLWRVAYIIIQGRDISQLGDWTLNPKGEWAWNDRGVLSALTLYYDLMYKYKVWPREFLGMKGSQLDQLFAQGKIAIIDNGLGVITNAVANWNKAVGAGVEKGSVTDAHAVILPRPSYMKDHTAMVQIDEGLLVFRQKKDKGPEHLQNVIAALRLMQGPLGQSRIALQGQWPANKLTAEAYGALLDPSNPQWALETLREKSLKVRAPWPTETKEQLAARQKVEALYNTELRRMMSDNVQPKEILKNLNAEARKLGLRVADTSVVD